MTTPSSTIFDIVEQIAATSSKNEKQAMIAAHKDDETWKRVLNATYNPFMNYGIRKIPERSAEGTAEFDEGTWLLLEDLAKRNLSGNAARDSLTAEFNRLEPKSAELLKRIVLKDLRADFSESSINKAIKGLIPDFPYMRCSLPKEVKLDEWDWSKGIISQEKADGMFVNVDHELSGLVSMRTRQGTPIPMGPFAAIEADLQRSALRGIQLHGEILVLVDGKVAERQIGNGILNRVLNGSDFEVNEKPILKVWDAIPLEFVVTKGKCDIPYEKRLASLFQMFPLVGSGGRSVNVIDTKILTSLKDAYAHFSALLKQGKEGTIIKQREMTWKDGTSKGQVKLKLEVTVDLKVVAILPGKDNSKNAGRAGSLTCESACGSLRVDVAVKNEKMRDVVDAKPDDWIGRIMPVTANEILEPSASNDLHSLFLPRFAEDNYRLDKDEADDLARVRLQFESAMAA